MIKNKTKNYLVNYKMHRSILYFLVVVCILLEREKKTNESIFHLYFLVPPKEISLSFVPAQISVGNEYR